MHSCMHPYMHMPYIHKLDAFLIPHTFVLSGQTVLVSTGHSGHYFMKGTKSMF